MSEKRRWRVACSSCGWSGERFGFKVDATSRHCPCCLRAGRIRAIPVKLVKAPDHPSPEGRKQ